MLTLICALIPVLSAYGLTVSTLKHTHHDIDPDPPGKDSRRHREAGAQEVMLVGPRRTVTVAAGPSSFPLLALVARLRPVDLVLVEGFREKAYPKIEVWRAALGKPRAVPETAVLAVATVRADMASVPPPLGVPVLDLDDPAAVAAFLIDRLGLSRPETMRDNG
ncbi:MAG: molybdopterin-guanine dinucleotide biosynthesis protein B [Rhodospirillaceae bacterium]|nr:MAG: molybdopterin-guanine dinucleotide biosynthesis protein B [Rhodospirillaceae bacterium]